MPRRLAWALAGCLLAAGCADTDQSGVSPTGFWERELALFVDNWRRYVAGEPLRNVVDKHEGY